MYKYNKMDEAHAEETVTNFILEELEKENKCVNCPKLPYCDEWTICTQ